MKWKVNPERLQWCLDFYGISLEELAKHADIALPALEEAAAGKEALSYDEMYYLAASCEVGKYFLTSGKPLKEDGFPMTPQVLAACACLPPRSFYMRRMIVHADRFRDHYEFILEDLNWQEMLQVDGLHLMGYSSDFAANAAKVREWLGIKGGEDFDGLRRLLEDKGILVLSSLSYYEGMWKDPEAGKEVAHFKGFTLDYDSLPVLFITRHQEKQEMAFAMMHGLAHLIMHQGVRLEDAQSLAFFPKTSNKEEEEANMLASHILLPDDALAEIQTRGFGRLKPAEIQERLRPICEKHCVNAAAVLARLHGAGKIAVKACQRQEEWRDEQATQATTPGKDASEIDELIHFFGRKCVMTVVSAVDRRSITCVKAANYMSTSIKTYEELEEWAHKTPY
ncbi:MAG: ImmA/IrrE family metallo-endopeptidase [Betaproteobacteria bacterium AqS2]|uniref:ImmA/IrrE family metallo-endopeptidase n=1 Tax=Candidatus Amphirhobacter heronislandensis TaxID=1732024 RepID=A0A930UIF8_9GAMM|nr:ImmA/IrrE family metallo-endopeptidase [Betaproteobacteria bacterium AqS2]